MTRRESLRPDDDTPVGRVLTRREALASLVSISGAAFLAACMPSVLTSATPRSSAAASASAALPGCIVRPELVEGPYFVDERLDRSDIRSDPDSGAISAGAPLAMAFVVSRVSADACTPLAGALVDVWHCDALGVYSDVQDPGGSTVGQKFLRGYQVTDAAGRAAFTTIYPGWYSGRAVHIHFKIRTDADASGALEFTSQLFFDDTLSDSVYAAEPYAAKGAHDVQNADDGIYVESSGQTLLNVTQVGAGYASTFDIGVQVD